MNINANKIKELEIPYCSIENQKKILQKVKELTPILENTLEKIRNIYLVDDSTNKNLSYIKQLKQAILQEAIE
jgi:restriction endonuclease S subunit